MPRITISIANIHCNSTAYRFGPDDLYFITTLRCGRRGQSPDLENPIPNQWASSPGTVLEINDRQNDNFTPPYNIAFSGDCEGEGAVVGSLYFFDKRGMVDFERRTRPMSWWEAIGRSLVYAWIAAGIAASLSSTLFFMAGGPLPLEKWLIVIGITLGTGLLTGLLIHSVVDDAVVVRDVFIGGIPVDFPVRGPSPEEHTYNLSAANSRITRTTHEIAIGGTNYRFDAAAARVNYDITLRINRETG